jgi:3-demethoxyubiquinol 3-hydroxylase
MELVNRMIVEFDRGLRTLCAPAQALRDSPAANVGEAELSAAEKQRAARLMRVNHTGEVCAQALYRGQALTSRRSEVRDALDQASREEEDHLAWCELRLAELGSRKSLLNPLWYGGSFALGTLSGLLGDKWNLAFLAETERQVEGHLTGHLDKMPAADRKSQAILEQMREDEAKHAATALEHGAAEMPAPLKGAMRLGSKLMTSTTYWL